MFNLAGKTALVTGASGGIGGANIEKLNALATELNGTLYPGSCGHQ